MPRLCLYFLGTPRIEKDGTPIKVDTRKAIALLCYLAVTGQSHRRDALDNLLWPEYDQTRARTVLRRTLYALSKALGDGWLDVDGEVIGLNPKTNIWLDVDEFHSYLAQCQTHGHLSAEVCRECVEPLTEAVGLYRGDFLEGFSLRDSVNFDDWQFFQTQRLRSDMVGALRRLAQCHREQGEMELAIGYALRWLELDRTSEEAHRQLIESYARTGQRAAALRQYEECVRILEKELRASPQEATTELYEAIKENKLIADFLPRKSQGAVPNNLPIELSRFIGRERETGEVKRLLSTARLLTLTGAGGCGKTRLALKVAWDLVEEYRDGVWLVDLAPLSDSAFVPQTVAGALDVSEQPGRPLLSTLSDYLKSKQVLLALDNCEHLIVACAALSETLLHTCPNLKILATSREAMGIVGETVWRVPSLSLPDPKSLPPLEGLMQYEAISLFIDRAVAVQPAFAVTNQNASIVADVCRRLDGIPLAIELAAARARALSVGQIAERLDGDFRLLTGGSRTALPRHQTLRATMDWSYNLLSEAERALLRRLSVFAGGFTLPAAEAICSDPGIAGAGLCVRSDEVIDLLTHLVDKSLVVMEGQSREGRYRLLETIRQYGREKLLESGEASTFRGRHLGWFLGLAERAEPELKGRDQIAWLDRLEVEHDNLRAALEWSMGSEEAETELRLAGALYRFWFVRGYFSEGSGWLEGALSRGSGVLASARVKVLIGAGSMALFFGDSGRATMLGEESLTLSREAGDNQGIAMSLDTLVQVALDQGDYDRAAMLGGERLTLYREVGDKWSIAHSLYKLGIVAQRQGDYGRATGLYEESLDLFREVGDKLSIADLLISLGQATRIQGNYVRATELDEESLVLQRELGNKVGIAISLSELGFAAQCQGDYKRAAVILEEDVALRREMGHKWIIPYLLGHLGLAVLRQGDYERARSLCEEGLALAREVENKEATARSLYHLGVVALNQGDYVQAAALLKEGLVLSGEIKDKLDFTWCLEGLAEAVAAEGQQERGARLFGAAEALREDMGAPLPPSDRPDYDRSLSSVRTGLGEEAFAAAWAEGRKMAMEEAIQLAVGGGQ